MTSIKYLIIREARTKNIVKALFASEIGTKYCHHHVCLFACLPVCMLILLITSHHIEQTETGL